MQKWDIKKNAELNLYFRVATPTQINANYVHT